MAVRQNPVTSLLASHDRALIDALSYRFKSTYKHKFETVEDLEGAHARLVSLDSTSAIFVHLSGNDSREIEFIQVAKSANPARVVIALCADDPKLGVAAFFAGADDVVAWPCNLDELAIRLLVRLGLPLAQKALSVGDVGWQLEAYIANRSELTVSEAQLVQVLYDHEGQTVSRDNLSFAVDERPWLYGDRKFDVHIAKIRKKLLEHFGTRVSISTIRSSGYCLAIKGTEPFEGTLQPMV